MSYVAWSDSLVWMCSRNKLLSPEARSAALAIPEAMQVHRYHLVHPRVVSTACMRLLLLERSYLQHENVRDTE